MCGATWRRAWPRFADCSPGSTRSTPSSASPSTTRVWKNFWQTRPGCRTPSRPPTAGTWTGRSRSRWTPSAARRVTRTWARSRAARCGAWPSAGCSSRSPISCCWTSPPTTSTRSRWPGSSSSSRSIRGRWWRSPTTATSSTTWRAGSSSSIAARASRGRATTRPGSTRRSSGWPSRRSRRPRVSARSSASSSGCACRRGRVRPSRSRACRPTSSCSRRAAATARVRPRSSSRRARVWATWWCRWSTSSRATATGC